VISGLRYCYIIRRDWLDKYWPDHKTLRLTALGAVFLILTGQLLTNSVCFLVLATPYGWPAKSFFNYVPVKVQSVIIMVCLIVFLFPVGLSIFVYLLLLKHRRTFELKNKIGIAVSHSGGQHELVESNSKVNYNLFNVQYDQSHLSQSPTFQQQMQLEPESNPNSKKQIGLEIRRFSLNILNHLDTATANRRLTKSMSDLTQGAPSIRCKSSNYFEGELKLNKDLHNNSKTKNPKKNLTSIHELIKKEEIEFKNDSDRDHFIAEKLAAIR